MLDPLHFIHPSWLLALLPLGLLAWQVVRPRAGDNAWQRVVDTRLLPLLLIAPTSAAGRRLPWLLGLGWLVATLALADPTWERRPQPVFQTGAARVVVLDLSSSMNATDLKPTRLARARYKVEDVLGLGAEGQTGLVVYAGDAYTVTPLTRDVNTIRSQLQALAPDLMPSDGSRADLGLRKAGELLRQAGMPNGQVLLIADGIAPDALAPARQAAAHLAHEGYRVSVLDIGAAQPAGAADASAPGSPAPADAAGLRSIAEAGGGADLPADAGIASLRAWVETHGPSAAALTPGSDATARSWVERGPLLAVLLLPIAALAFRRNWLLSVLLLPFLAMPPHEAMASTWSDLWQRPEQQAARSLQTGDYARAARLATDADRRGSAEYKRGNFAQALADFSQVGGAPADYNRGNALAKLGRYPDAIAAYDQSLKVDPTNADARANKEAVEALLKQQQSEKQSPEQKAGEQAAAARSGSKKDAKQDASAKDSAPQSASAKDGAPQGAPGQGGHQRPSADQAQAEKKPGAAPGAHGGGQAEPSGQGNEGKPSPAPGQPDSKAAQPDPKAAQAGASNRSAPGDGQGQKASSAEAKAAAAGDRPETSPSPAPKPPATGHDFADAARRIGNPETTPSPQGDPAAGETDGGRAAEKTNGGRAAGRAPSASKARPGVAASADSAPPLPTEEQLAAEQWLRRIPDDPGGLLRRKFLYQYRQRAQQAPDDAP